MDEEDTSLCYVFEEIAFFKGSTLTRLIISLNRGFEKTTRLLYYDSSAQIERRYKIERKVVAFFWLEEEGRTFRSIYCGRLQRYLMFIKATSFLGGEFSILKLFANI